MARNTARNTRCEVQLCAELRRLQLAFRRNVRSLQGQPDIVFPERHVAVFCDGDFWHGRRWALRKKKLARGSNGEYWVAKIEANIRRDRRQRAALRRSGWRVIRLWESDILRDPNEGATKILSGLKKREI